MDFSVLISLTLILFYCYIFTKYVISIVDSLITNLPLSATFLGLTINAWGGNISGTFIINIMSFYKLFFFV